MKTNDNCIKKDKKYFKIVLKFTEDIAFDSNFFPEIYNFITFSNDLYTNSKDTKKFAEYKNRESSDYLSEYKKCYSDSVSLRKEIIKNNSTKPKVEDKVLQDDNIRLFKKFISILKKYNLKINYALDSTPLHFINDLLKNYIKLKKEYPAHMKNYTPPNFYNYFYIDLNRNEREDSIQNILNELRPLTKQSLDGLFDYIYIQPIATPTYIEVTSTAANQNYFNEMEIDYSEVGAYGENVNITQIEANFWDIRHSQFNWGESSRTVEAILNIMTLSEAEIRNNTDTDLSEHGNGVLGILKAKHGNKDKDGMDLCKGIIPKANYTLASLADSLQPYGVYNSHNQANTILASIHNAIGQNGAILLIEYAIYQQSYPAIFEPLVYELVGLANANNIIFIEGAGNGHNNIPTTDTQYFDSIYDEINNFLVPNHIWNQYFDYTNRTSEPFQNINNFVDALMTNPRAITIGAYQKDGNTYTKTYSSNWGNPFVKVYAQGASIKTVDYDYSRANNRKSKYRSFGDTSGAVAIMTGICGSLQGIAHEREKYINPQYMMELLDVTENSDTVTINNPIGYAPNYIAMRSKLLREIDLLPDL